MAQWYSINRTTGAASLLNDPAIPAYQFIPVQITNPRRQTTSFTFSFEAPGAHTNSVQFKNNLTDALWQTLTNFPGLGAQTTVTDALATNNARFYRVVTE